MSAINSFPELLKSANQHGASDIHFTAGTPVRVRIAGKLCVVGDPLTPADTQAIARHILEKAGRKMPADPLEFDRDLREEDV